MSKASPVRVGKDDLTVLIKNIFRAVGTSEEDAAVISEVLVWANLRGVDSHGISRVPRYIELFESGESKPKPNIKVERPRPAIIIVDGDSAPGPVAISRAAHEAIETARKTGVAWASVRGTVHAGAIGYYTALVAEQGLAAIAMVAGVPNMAWVGGAGKAVATSPLSIAVPVGDGAMPILDMATATIALGKIAQFKNRGEPLPEGAALTDDGRPTTDPARASVPTPMAGAKGSGMSLMFEFLTSVLVGNGIFADYHNKPAERRHRQNASMIVADVSAFTSLESYQEAVRSALDTLKGLPAGDASGALQFPGERGARTHAERSQKGIPIPAGPWSKVVVVAEKLGVSLPKSVS